MRQHINAAHIHHHATIPSGKVGFHHGPKRMNRSRVHHDVNSAKACDRLRYNRAHRLKLSHIAAFNQHSQTLFFGVSSQRLVSSRFDAARHNLRAARSQAQRNRPADSRRTRNQSHFS